MATVDLLVIGGGIHGACVARDAALRGLSVVLAEKDDLAEGTSSRSSKLIHGGLRYLETGQFGLVKEALAERAILLRTAPDLVRPLTFLLPFHDGAPKPAWLVRLGLALYDTLARAHDLPPHRALGRAEALALEPGLPAQGLKGAALFHDAQMDDARLVVANAVAAARAGAVIRTHTRVNGLAPAGGPERRPHWRAHLEGGDTVETRAVVNATGPWADQVRAIAGLAPDPVLRPTRGSHVVVPALTQRHALLLFARRDGRVLFVLPRGPWSLVGTTDVDDPVAPDGVHPTAFDLRYLWEEIKARWPEHEAARDPVAATARAFSGLRPLVKGGSRKPWDNAREARIVAENGVFSLAGGKYTTARRLAERAVDAVVAWTGKEAAPCATARETLPGPADPERMRALATRARTGEDPVEGLTRAEVEVAVTMEFARTVGDVLWRRSALWLDRAAARRAAPHVARWMAEPLAWTDAARAMSLAAALAECDEEERWIQAAAHSGDQ